MKNVTAKRTSLPNRIRQWFGFGKRAANKLMARRYAAAKINRLNADWSAAGGSANQEIRESLPVLRNRSRGMARNNPYYKKFLNLVRQNVAGPNGIGLQVVPESPKESDAETIKHIQAQWAKWCHRESASASGMLSFAAIQQMCIRATARDGEVLYQTLTADNPWGFALKYIDPAWLDENHNDVLPNGSVILMGVEVDKNGRRVAYHLRPPNDTYLAPERSYVTTYRRRVPADQIIHFFLLEDDESQTRGVPWAHAAMSRLQMLGAYEDAEVVAARLEASKGLAVTRESDLIEDDDASATAFHEDVEPGAIWNLPPGYDIKTIDPNHPNPNQAGFAKAILRGVAAGLDQSYVSLATDLEGVNFSSIRSGLLDERDAYRLLQQILIEAFNRVVFRRWLLSSILTGAVKLPAAGYERFSEPNWRPRGWDWVDPKNDVQSSVLSMQWGMTSRTSVLAKQGIDIEDVFRELKRENELADEAGITIKAATPAPSSNADSSDDEEKKPAD